MYKYIQGVWFSVAHLPLLLVATEIKSFDPEKCENIETVPYNELSLTTWKTVGYDKQ